MTLTVSRGILSRLTLASRAAKKVRNLRKPKVKTVDGLCLSMMQPWKVGVMFLIYSHQLNPTINKFSSNLTKTVGGTGEVEG